MIPYDYKILDGILQEPSYYIYTCNVPTDSLLFRCKLQEINVPPVRFELTTARSSASLLNVSGRVLSQAELRRHVLNVVEEFLYNLVL
jgi:hypothetical protein